ncbi:cation diffusion facilitator family transporter [Candidatus Methylopumilus turicensis]|uniref:Cation diffusion facilitator family transporter n=1 Tax=Candidatus Methylopumilus turicensis TaxID=1581680 RepID=A0A0B7IZU4_9PROT|nr:cation diffusion facilitator family transporter [Candidatus Methylopumilus turicensis]CEN56615.1 Cation diffusion facilitator family transporter [Candidatus Methylopumilus turicensis]
MSSHKHPHPQSHQLSFDDPKRYALSKRCTWTSVFVNIGLTIVQVIVGIFAHSQSLIADGVHSLSDLISDFLVLIASYHSKSPADEDHPYGHGRIETAASLVLGAILILTGVGIMYSAAIKLDSLGDAPPISSLALWTAGLALIAKEALFRYMLYVGEQLRSPLLIANAWHARSDAASSLVVAVGIAANMMGFIYADAIAAILVGFMIVRMGLVFMWEAFQELIDAGLSFEEVASIRQTLMDTQGVQNVHELRTRKMAHRVLVDAHILVDSKISVSEGHSIAERARKRVIDTHESVNDVLVHVDTEDDGIYGEELRIDLPSRDELTKALSIVLEGLPKPEQVTFHYLAGKVEADVLMPHEGLKTKAAITKACQLIEHRLIGHAYFSQVRLAANLN